MNTKQIVENMEKELEKEMGIDTWNDGKWIKSGQIMLSKDFFNHIRPHISSLLSAFAEELIGKNYKVKDKDRDEDYFLMGRNALREEQHLKAKEIISSIEK